MRTGNEPRWRRILFKLGVRFIVLNFPRLVLFSVVYRESETNASESDSLLPFQPFIHPFYSVCRLFLPFPEPDRHHHHHHQQQTKLTQNLTSDGLLLCQNVKEEEHFEKGEKRLLCKWMRGRRRFKQWLVEENDRLEQRNPVAFSFFSSSSLCHND